jgi:hypothetical protein
MILMIGLLLGHGAIAHAIYPDTTKKGFELDGIDGPYIINKTEYRISENNKLIKSKIDRKEQVIVNINNADQDKFSLLLKDRITKPDDIYEMPEKLIAISDIEGNFNGLSGFLISNKVIDKNFDWIFGNGHLVLNGDFVDRGRDVTQVLWLIYKLDGQAEKQGGKVHYILGNHEIMNFQGNGYYSHDKYIKAAQLISRNEDIEAATKFMYSLKTELGKWLRSKNVIEKIGDILFVHAGLSPNILDHQMSISQINAITRSNWDQDLYLRPGTDEKANFLQGVQSPIWYRGLAQEYKYYPKISDDELDQILAFYRAEKIVIGHSVVGDVTSEFDGKVVNIDVKHGHEKYSGHTKGIYIVNGDLYKIDDMGSQVKL